MRTVGNAIHVPSVRIGFFIDDINAETDPVQIIVRGSGTRVDHCNFHALTSIISRQLIKPHRFLPPSHDLLLWKICQRRPVGKRSQSHDIRLIDTDVRMHLVKTPIIGLWLDVQAADRLRRFAKQGQRNLALFIRNAVGGQKTPE